MEVNVIFLSPEQRTVDDLGDAELIQQDISWCYENLDCSDILTFSVEDSVLLQQETAIFNVISKENDNMLISVGMEDDWIFENEVKNRVKQKLSKLNYRDERLNNSLHRIILLLDKAVKESKGVYFVFSCVS